MSMWAQIVGGRRDGEIVPVDAPCLYESILSPAVYVCAGATPELATVRVYDLCRGFDGEYFYVLRR